MFPSLVLHKREGGLLRVKDDGRRLCFGDGALLCWCNEAPFFCLGLLLSFLLAAVCGMGVSLLLREQPGTLRIWIGSGESTSEKKGWDNSGDQPHERCPLAHLLEPLPTVFAMSLNQWPPPPPPESNSPVSGVGKLGGDPHLCF